MDNPIPIFDLKVSEGTIARVAEVLRAGWLSEGRQVRSFESAFCGAFGLPRALALNSGTSALHLALIGAGVKPGDEVLTTTQTFVATAMSVLYVGATPVFADIKSRGANIDPADIERRITDRTRAIVPVHYGGYPCDMDEIAALAGRHGLAVIEDAAHALGGTYRGRAVGALGRFGIFSFQAIKHITTGDGGMLVCHDDGDHEAAYRRRWFGIDRARRRPSEIGQPEWDISEVGYKYHMNDLAATLGIEQLAAFPPTLARRRALNARYRRELNGMAGLELLEELADRESSCWLFTVLVERRLDFIRAIRSRGVDAAVWHRRIDRNSLFGGIRQDLPNQASFDERQVSIPLRANLTDEETDRVIAAVRQGW